MEEEQGWREVTLRDGEQMVVNGALLAAKGPCTLQVSGGASVLKGKSLRTAAGRAAKASSGEDKSYNAIRKVATRREPDYAQKHGLAAPVDVSTGRLGAASDMGLKPSTRWHEAHPVTGGRIEGCILPYWTEAKTLVTEAHARLGDRVVIGCAGESSEMRLSRLAVRCFGLAPGETKICIFATTSSPVAT